MTLSLAHYWLMMCTYINSTFKISQTAIWEITRICEYLEWKFKNSTSQGNLNTTLISFRENNLTRSSPHQLLQVSVQISDPDYDVTIE